MLMKFTSPGAQRVVEAVEARESKRLFHLRNKKTVADQIQKCAKAVAADHTGIGFSIRRPSAQRRRHVLFGNLTPIFAMWDSWRMSFSAWACMSGISHPPADRTAFRYRLP